MRKIKNIACFTMIAFVLCASLGNISIQANDEQSSNNGEVLTIEADKQNGSEENVEVETPVVELAEEDSKDAFSEGVTATTSRLDNRAYTVEQEAELWGFDLEFFKLLKSKGQLPSTQLTQADFDKITFLTIVGTPATLTSMKGIEKLNNLATLTINSTSIRNEEVPRIQALLKLKKLEVSYNNSLTNIGLLGDMDSLESLLWESNGGSLSNQVYTHGESIDLNGIKGKFANLTKLSIAEIPTLNAEVCGTFNKLERLDLYDTGLSNISFVENLPNLTYLEISNNRVFDLSALKGRNNVTVYAADQRKVNYGELAVDFDIVKETSFKTDATMVDSTGAYVSNVTGYTVNKGTYDSQNIVWTGMTEADFKSYTYNDTIANEKIVFKGVGFQMEATNLPTNIKSFSGIIYQEVLLVDKLPATLEINGNDVYITEGDSIDLMDGVVATDYN